MKNQALEQILLQPELRTTEQMQAAGINNLLEQSLPWSQE